MKSIKIYGFLGGIIMKKLIAEFKEFATQGSMMDLAVGMIIGAAFTSIINSLVDDIINPVIGIFTGKIDFSSLFVALDGNHYDSLKAAQDAGAAVIKYGSFLSALINFIIVALVVFFMMKGLSALRKATGTEAAEEEAATKACPFCKTEIALEATRCPNCTSELPAVEAPAPEEVPSPEIEAAPAE